MDLFYFLAGVVFCKWISPLIDLILEVVATKLEAHKAVDALRITQLNEQIKSIAENEALAPKRPIGFTSSPAKNEEENIDREDN